MGKSEHFMKRIHKLISELKLPLIDERFYYKVKINSNKTLATVKIVFEEDESVIKGFLGLAEFFHTIIIKRKGIFYIPTDSSLFILESS